MHNLHLIVVKADSPEAACEFVEGYIEDWGNENNWRTICGSVSEDNGVFIYESGRFPPDSETDTIAKINTMVDTWLKPDVTEGDLVDDLIKGKKSLADVKTWHEWWQVKDYAAHMSDSHYHLGKNFDILSGDTFRESEYGNIGVTNVQDEEGEKTYIVFIDMHS